VEYSDAGLASVPAVLVVEEVHNLEEAVQNDIHHEISVERIL